MKITREDTIIHIEGTPEEIRPIKARAEKEELYHEAIEEQVIMIWLEDEDERWIDFNDVHYVVTGQYQDYRDRKGLWEQDVILRDILRHGETTDTPF